MLYNVFKFDTANFKLLLYNAQKLFSYLFTLNLVYNITDIVIYIHRNNYYSLALYLQLFNNKSIPVKVRIKFNYQSI